jgi:hypothetical protein
MSRQYLVVHMTDRDGEGWDDATDIARLDDWIADTKATGRNLGGSPVGERDEAKAVAVRGGEVVVTDGPFPEFKEWFMGYDLISADSMQEAVDIVATHPSAKLGKLYVLPAVPLAWKREDES